MMRPRIVVSGLGRRARRFFPPSSDSFAGRAGAKEAAKAHVFDSDLRGREPRLLERQGARPHALFAADATSQQIVDEFVPDSDVKQRLAALEAKFRKVEEKERETEAEKEEVWRHLTLMAKALYTLMPGEILRIILGRVCEWDEWRTAPGKELRRNVAVAVADLRGDVPPFVGTEKRPLHRLSKDVMVASGVDAAKLLYVLEELSTWVSDDGINARHDVAHPSRDIPDLLDRHYAYINLMPGPRQSLMRDTHEILVRCVPADVAAAHQAAVADQAPRTRTAPSSSKS